MSSGRVAMVTGAAGSIGSAIAAELAETADQVILVDRDPVVQQVADKLSAASKASCSAITANLAISDEVHRVVAAILDQNGGVDILVNCAGINRQADNGDKFFLEDVTDAGWGETFAVNLTAPFMLTRAFVAGMKERRWGRIINIASRAGRTYVAASNVDYSSSKAGLVGLSRMVAGECAPFGITVNTIAPGRVSSSLADSQSSEIIEEQMRHVPIGRIGDATDVAHAVRFFADDRAAFITGSILDLNGGAFMP